MSGFIELTLGAMKKQNSDVVGDIWKFEAYGKVSYRRDMIVAVDQQDGYSRVSFNPDFIDAIKVKETKNEILLRISQ